MKKNVSTRCLRVDSQKTTTVALEPEYWDMLDAILKDVGLTLGKFARALKAKHPDGHLTSLIRIYITKHYYDAYQASLVSFSRENASAADGLEKSIAFQSHTNGQIGGQAPLPSYQPIEW